MKVIKCPFCNKAIFEVLDILDKDSAVICGECKPKYNLIKKVQDLEDIADMVKRQEKTGFW